MSPKNSEGKIGFTLVELVVVISIIGILSVIGIISYNGWKQYTIVSQLKSDLNGVVTAMENARNFGDSYPADINSVTTFKSSNGVTLSGGSSDAGKTYCVSAFNSQFPNIYYYVNSAIAKLGALSGTCGPNTIAISSVSSSSISLSWATVSGATSYTVQQDTNANFSSATTFVTQAGNTYTSTGLTGLTTYYYRVKAIVNSVDSDWSATVSAITVAPPAAPSAPVIAVTLSGSNVLATITPVTACTAGTVQYQINSRTNDGAWTGWTAWSTTLTATQTANDGVKYGYKAQARCYLDPDFSTTSTGTESNYIDLITTPIAPIVALTTTGVTTTYSWGVSCPSGTNVRYQYRYTINLSTPYDSGIIATAATSVGFTTSTEGLAYTVAVSAECYNAATASGMSTAGSVSYYRPFSLTLIAGTGGTVSGAGLFNFGETSTITATPSAGYAFDNWSGSTGCSGLASHTITINETKSCTANFISTYTLTIAAGTGGTVNAGGTYNSGTTQTITATPSTYYSFSSWSGSTGCSGVASHTITMDAAKSCTANFIPTAIAIPTTPTVTTSTPDSTTTYSWGATTCTGNTARYQYRYTISPSGYDSGLIATASISVGFTTSTEGQTYTVAVSAECYNTATSSGMSTAGSASYHRPFSLTLIAGTGGSVSGAGLYSAGTSPTITATPSTYYSFSNWTGDTDCSGVASHTITMSSNKTCTANFTPTVITAPSAPVVTVLTPSATSTWSWPAISCGTSTARYLYKYTISPTGYDSGWTATASTSVLFTSSTEDQTYTVTVQAQCYNIATTSAWSASGSAGYYRPIPQCTLTLVAGANGTVSGGGTFDCGTTPATPTITALPNTYYSFNSWTGETGCSGLVSHNITTDTNKTCTASFVPTTITAPSAPVVTVLTPSATSTWSWPAISCGSNTARYQYKYTISPSGFNSGWVGPQAGTSVDFTTSTEGQTYVTEVQAQCYNAATGSNWSTSGSDSYLRPITYKTLALVAGSNGAVSGSGSYATLSAPTMTATPNANYIFSSWSGDTGCSGVASHTITMDGAKSCTANFVLNTCVLTVTGGTGGGTYTCGTTQNVAASVPTYYSFSSWSGSCSGGASTSVVMTGDISCTANFTPTAIATPATPTVTPSTPDSTTTYSWGAALCPGNTATYEYRYTINSSTPYDSGIVSTNSTSVNFTTSTEGLTYTVAVHAMCYNAVTSSSWSAYGSGSYLRPITYKTLTLVAGAGSTSGAGSYATNSMATMAVTPYYGYNFSSWTGDTGCSGVASHTIAMTVDKSCTANFTNINYTLTVAAGTGGTVSGGGSYAYNSAPYITATPSTYYSYSSWTGDTGCSGVASHTIAIDGNKSCTAAFTLNTCTLTLTGATGAGSYGCGTTRSVTATVPVNYQFTNWTGGCTGGVNGSVVMTGNISCTANFTINNFTLTVAGGTGGTVSGGGTYAYGSTPTITATESTGYTFSAWSGTGCSGVASHTVTVTSTMSCTASFTVTYYALTLTPGTGGTVSGAGSYAYNTNATMTASASADYIFGSWSGSTGCSGVASHTILMTSARSCTAAFTYNMFTLTLLVSAATPWGTVKQSGTSPYVGGSTPTITATPNSGRTFNAWTGSSGCVGTASHTISMTIAKSCTASFK